MAIPGVTTLIRDRLYTSTRQDTPQGPRIVAIARRDTADLTGGISDLDVVRATNEKDVINAFGNGSDIHRAYLELAIAGASQIYLVPLPSNTTFDHSTGDITSGGTSIFDAAFVAAEAAVPDMIVPWGRGSNSYDWESPATPGNDREYGFHANNSATVAYNWTYKCGVKAKDISENTNPCIVILGVKPYLTGVTEAMTPAAVSTHLGMSNSPQRITNLPDRDASGMGEVGPYIAVIAAEIKPVGYSSANATPEDFGYSNGATFLAASLSKLSSYSAIINKPIYNVQSIRYLPTRTQQTALSNSGVNCAIVNFNKIPVFGEGLTFGKSTSDYTRLTTKRIIDEATNVIRQVCQRYIGEPSTIQTRNSMETAITSGLRGMQILGAILDSDFTVSYVPSQNKAIVDLVITPAFELKNIEVQVAINL